MSEAPVTLKDQLAALEQAHREGRVRIVWAALLRAAGVVQRAAEELGKDAATLQRWLKDDAEHGGDVRERLAALFPQRKGRRLDGTGKPKRKA